MSRVELEFDKTTNSWFLERPFKENLDLPKEDQLDFVPYPEEGWTIKEVSQVFKSWLDQNERKYIKDMEDPKVKISLKDKEFELKFITTYTYKIRLEEVQKKLGEDE